MTGSRKRWRVSTSSCPRALHQSPAAAPSQRGLPIRQAAKILQGLKGLNVIGGDVVCMMPTKDNPNQITAQVAMVIAFEILSLIAYRMKRS